MGRTSIGSRALRAGLAIALAAHGVRAQSVESARDTAVVARTMQFPSPRAATWITIGATVLPMAAGVAMAGRTHGGSGNALMVAGVLAGPMVGAWYGGTLSSSWSGALLRTGGIAIAAAGVSGCASGTHSLAGCSPGDETAMFAGAMLAFGGAVYEMATVGDRVREHNEAEARAMVLPLFSPSMRSVGVAVVVGF